MALSPRRQHAGIMYEFDCVIWQPVLLKVISQKVNALFK